MTKEPERKRIRHESLSPLAAITVPGQLQEKTVQDGCDQLKRTLDSSKLSSDCVVNSVVFQPLSCPQNQNRSLSLIPKTVCSVNANDSDCKTSNLVLQAAHVTSTLLQDITSLLNGTSCNSLICDQKQSSPESISPAMSLSHSENISNNFNPRCLTIGSNNESLGDSEKMSVALDLSSSYLTQGTKEKEEIAAKKKLINLASREFQENLERIILSLGQQNGRNLPKSKLCMLQLCILMHSAQCRKPVSCLVPQCKVIKGVLGHMSVCRDNRCKVMHCTPSKQLIRHWNICHIQCCDPCQRILDASKGPLLSENADKAPVNWDKSNLKSLQTQRMSDFRFFSSTNISEDVWSTVEFVSILRPVLEKLWNMGIASQPFHHPVNPELDLCPDYFNIITHPMDLGTIRKKLNEGAYKNPWGFVEDIYQMFRNAWCYNHYTSKYYKYATKLAVAFEKQIDSIMQSLGYCCGRQYTYSPPVIECNTKNACSIKPYAVYYTSPHGFIVCEDCFSNSTGIIEVFDENTQRNLLTQKLALSKKHNAELTPEEIVSCTKCGRAFHSICVLYSAELWPCGYICRICVLFYGIKYFRNYFTSKCIPETDLSHHLEQRIDRFFARCNISNPNVFIRVLASCHQETRVLPKFKQYFPEVQDSFAYISKAIYAFQEQDEEDVCFFSLYVQEYGSDVSGPNSRCVYLAYLDSVNLFTPPNCRTGLYNDIIQGYMEYIKQRGFLRMFIWSCPPSMGDDYIFYCHPENQKIPKPRRLHDWYMTILNRSVFEGVVESYKDMFVFALEENFKSPLDVPYFSGDYWPNVIEELLGILDKQTNSETVLEGNAMNCQTEKPKNKRCLKSKMMSKASLGRNDALMEKLFDSFRKNRGMFFVVEFYSFTAKTSSFPPIIDKDKLNPNELMNNRNSFLIFAQTYHLEFSSLRRAKFSTQAALIEYDRCNSLGVVCGNCSVSVGNSNGLLACQICKNFQLCLVCYEELGHEHQMHQTWNSKELCDRISDLQCLKDDLKHAVSCLCSQCPERNCSQLKNAIDHMHSCAHKKTCKKCRCIFAVVCIHARSCIDQNCSIILCNEVKRKQNDKRCAQLENEARIMRRRMHTMASKESGENSLTLNTKLTEIMSSRLSENSSRGKCS